MTINKARVVEFHSLFKEYKFFRLGNSKDITGKRKPKRLRVALFVAALFPIFRKGFRRLFLSASVIAIIDLSSAK